MNKYKCPKCERAGKTWDAIRCIQQAENIRPKRTPGVGKNAYKDGAGRAEEMGCK